MSIANKEIITDDSGYRVGYRVECAVCGTWFDATRFDAAFCSSTCRTRYRRSLKEESKRIERAEGAIDDLINILPDGEGDALAALIRLQKRIQDAIESVNV